MNTGIEQLDRLLGGGFDPGSVILLRGGPGSGKTTLALQLLDRHLAQGNANSSGDSELGAGVFLSLEVEPDRALLHVNRSFGFFGNLSDLWPAETWPPDANTLLPGSTRLIAWGKDTLERQLVSREATASPQAGSADGRLLLPKLLGPTIAAAIAEVPDVISSRRCLIVIDSLNALVGWYLAYYRQEVMPIVPDTLPIIRQILDGLGEMVRSTLKESIVVFTQEYHGEKNWEESLVAESFVCDTEVMLLHEPIAGQSFRSTESLSILGYGTERTLVGREKLPQVIETRSFCRVLKSRTQPSQSRRCAYDIVSGKGVIFFESYPGDGSILLFAENERQTRSWDEFFTRDVPHNYPALRFEHFDRSGLQRTFASQRGFRYRPSRMDLFLASFDTYWVSWYVELCQKWDLAAIWQQHLGLSDELLLPTSGSRAIQEAFTTLVCKVHQCLLVRLSRNEGLPPAPEFELLTREQWAVLGEGKDASLLRGALHASWEYLASPRGQGGLLHLTKTHDLRLFGELRSQIIAELEPQTQSEATDADRRRGLPVHRPLGPLARQDLVRSVPYDANISFLVCRTDLLRKLLRKQKPSKFIARIREIYDREKRAIGNGFPNFEMPSVRKLTDRLFDSLAPSTWEEVIALCQLKPGHHLLLETQNFDSFLCTLLEFLWGCGGNLSVRPDYEIDDYLETERRLYHAFWLLDLMFREAVIPRNSTLEVEQMADRFPGPRAQARKPLRDWLFARHWYSTFVEILTKEETCPRRERTQFVWRPSGIAMDISPIPITLSEYLRDPAEYWRNPDTKHASCWGEWHLGILAGSENEALGLDLINNLMSSQKICERAFSCAALPTVEEFYRLYGDNRCFNLPDRWDLHLPTITFQQMRDRLFRNGRFRSQAFDYRHCMRKLYAILQLVHTSPESSRMDLRQRVAGALGNESGIRSLQRKVVLTR